MEKINAKKRRKVTTRDRHLEWINYYCSKNFGIWVECSDCKKWRRTYQFSESHEVPENWCCSMLTLENGEKRTCDDPEEDTDEQYLEYSPGSVVWAKLDGYPWWPAIVDEDPDVEEFSWRENGTLSYNVTFLDEKPTRAWIPEVFICPFLKPPKKEKKFRQNKHAKALSTAKERAETAMKMTIKDRLQTYSFVHLYKGRWSAAANYEKCDDDENEQRNFDEMADILLKELDELGSIGSTDSDDERIEKDFSELENKMAERGKLQIKKKTYNTKYLNNKDFIPENEAMFPLMKKKNSQYSSSVNKTSSIETHQAESIATSLQEKEAKGIKRKVNRKFTPRKEKNFEKPSESLTDNIIDLVSDTEQKGDENSNASSVSKEDDSKSIHKPDDCSLARDNDIFEISNSEHETNENFNPVIEKKMNSKSLHVSTESFVTGGTDSGSSEVTNYEKHKDSGSSEVTNFEKHKDSGSSEVTNFEKHKDSGSSEVTNFEKHKTEKRANNVKPLDIEVLKHIDESISKVLELTENENLEAFGECNSSDRKKIKSSNDLQKKSQFFFENIKQSNSKIVNLEENVTQISAVLPENKVLQNTSNSNSKISKQIKLGTTKQTKKSQINIKTINDKMKEFPKQPNSSFSKPVKNSEPEDDGDMNKENKMPMATPQKLLKEPNLSVKVKPNFKQPVKADKGVSQGMTLKVAGTAKVKADIKQNNCDEYKENYPRNLVKSGEDKNNSVNKKLAENLQAKIMVSVPKENDPEVISIDDEDSAHVNGTMKSTENHDDNLFYVSLSDEDMDCETLKA